MPPSAYYSFLNLRANVCPETAARVRAKVEELRRRTSPMVFHDYANDAVEEITRGGIPMLEIWIDRKLDELDWADEKALQNELRTA